MNELDVQRELVKSAIAQGGFGWKLNNRFLKGVADILVKFPMLPAVVIEVKMVPGLGKKDVIVELTDHQERFLKRYRDAGGVSGWLAVAPIKPAGSYHLFASSTIDIKNSVLAEADVLIRRPGKTWPIMAIAIMLAKQTGRVEYAKSESSS